MAARLRTVSAALLVAASIAGCGSSNDDSKGSDSAAAPKAVPAAPASSFPSVAGKKGIEEVLADAVTGGPELAPSVSELAPGPNRFGFGLFDNDSGEMPAEDQVAIYIAKADGTGAKGPYTARRESLEVPPAFRSQQTANDATPFVWVTTVPFSKPGDYGAIAVVRRGGELLASSPVQIKVGKKGSGPPNVGDMAPKISTKTPADVGGDISKLTTRRPPIRSLVDTNIAKVQGSKPVVLGFATPQLCQTRVCGPVVDIMAQLQARYGEQVAFIQQEVYLDDNPSKGLRPQLVAYDLKTEPWTYVIDRTGRIAARFEGAFSAEELEAAVRGVAP